MRHAVPERAARAAWRHARRRRDAALGAWAEAVRAHEVGRHDGRWEDLTPADRERLEALTARIVGRLLDDPALRAAHGALAGRAPGGTPPP